MPKAICAARTKAIMAQPQLVVRQEHATPELLVRAGKEIALKRLVEGNLQGWQDVVV